MSASTSSPPLTLSTTMLDEAAFLNEGPIVNSEITGDGRIFIYTRDGDEPYVWQGGRWTPFRYGVK